MILKFVPTESHLTTVSTSKVQALNTPTISPSPTHSTTITLNIPQKDYYHASLCYENFLSEEAIEDVLFSKLNSEESKHKIRAVEVLSQIGSPSILNELRNIAYNTSEDADVREAAIKSLNWTSNPNDLVNLLNTDQSPEVLTAIVETLGQMKLEKSEREALSDNLYSSFQEHDLAILREAILDYATNDPYLLERLLSLDRQTFSEGVIEKIKEIENDMKSDNSQE